MSVYVVGFILSTLLLVISNKILKRQRWFVFLFALLIPCCIAGFRAETVGTDIRTYLTHMIDAAVYADNFKEYLNTSWFMVWRNVYVKDYEIGFILLVFLLTKVFNSIFVVQFVIQLITILPIFIAIKNMKVKLPIWLCMITYYLMIFNTTLNLMRQAIGMAFAFLAYVYLQNNKKKKSICIVIVAAMFHTSSLICVLIFLIYKFVNTNSGKIIFFKFKRPSYYANMVIVIILGIIAVLGSSLIVNIFSSIGFVKYLIYINGEVQFMPNQLISRLPIFILFIYNWRKMEDSGNERFLFTMICFDLLCSQFTSVNSFAGRVGLYFSQFEIITFPTMYIEAKKSKPVLFALMAYMIFYWWFYFVYSGINETIPYVVGG